MIDDRLLQSVYVTPTFRTRFAKEVAVRDIRGADFASIAALTTMAKSKGRQPFDDIYAILSLRRPNTQPDRTIWHTAVLLSADHNYVTMHDPREIPREATPGKNRMVAQGEFAQLWSLSSNRVQLFFVRNIVTTEPIAL